MQHYSLEEKKQVMRKYADLLANAADCLVSDLARNVDEDKAAADFEPGVISALMAHMLTLLVVESQKVVDRIGDGPRFAQIFAALNLRGKGTRQ